MSAPPHWNTSENSLASLAKISNSKMDYVLDVHQSYPFYQDRETKKLARTSCWYVPGRVVRMSSALLIGPFENKQMCLSSSRHP